MRFHLPTVFSALLAGSLLHNAAISAPLPPGDTQLEALDSSINSTIGHATVISPPLLPVRHTKRQGEPLAWEQAVETGRRNIGKLEDAEDTGCEDEIPSYTEHYVEGGQGIGTATYRTQEKNIFSDYWPLPVLESVGIKKTDKVTVKSIFSIKQKLESRFQQKPVSQNAFRPDLGVIFALSNFAAEDHNAPEDRLHPGELMLQAWDELAGSLNGGLAWIVRSHIANEDTLAIIKEARGRVGAREEEIFRITPAENPEEFQALSGTPNCRGIYPTLATHGPETMDKRVTELLVWDRGALYSFILMKIE
ncbi:hypothetical protein BJX64DRAFT_295143 [Aspergillus heterothallicus]